jgi:alpha-beta hydrolase superfamily lysophospholipase
LTPPQGPKSWLTDVLTGLVAVSGVGYVAVAYSISRWLTRTSPAPADLPALDEPLLLEPLECMTADGLRLAGWAVTPPRPRATIALFHGMRGNRAQIADRVAFLTSAGYRCVAFDHRAHGQSEGRRTSFGYYERLDVLAVLDLIERRWPDAPCAALGVSMGAAALCYAAPRTRRFQAVILESMYHDLDSAFRTRVGRGYPPWFHRFSRGIIWVTERRLGVRLTQLAPVDYIRQLSPVPVLLVTGSEDPHAPPHDAERLYARCREPRELAIIPGAEHGDVCAKGGPVYERCILGFLERRLAA